jgi:hypothetical protein
MAIPANVFVRLSPIENIPNWSGELSRAIMTLLKNQNAIPIIPSKTITELLLSPIRDGNVDSFRLSSP